MSSESLLKQAAEAVYNEFNETLKLFKGNHSYDLWEDLNKAQQHSWIVAAARAWSEFAKLKPWG